MPAAPAVQAAVPAPVTENRGPKLERPHIGIGVSMKEWNVFTHGWRVFKAGSGIDDISAPLQLFQCASKKLGDNLLKFDADVASRPNADSLTSMRRLAVIPIATGVLRTDLKQMCRRHDEASRAFAARVRGKVDTCAFSADRQCGQKVDYSDHIIRDTLLKDICDAEIRREVFRYRQYNYYFYQ